MTAPLTATIVFDAGYLEPALLTAFEMRTLSSYIDEIVLVVLDANPEDDAEAIDAVSRFCAIMRDSPGPAYVPIRVNGGLPSFSAYHFNSSILYKAIVPSFLPGERLVLNMDAGIMLGPGFPAFLDESLALLDQSPGWVLAAHTHETEGRLPAAWQGVTHHSRYPAGTLLMFNPQNYRAADWHTRFVTACWEQRGNLSLAEQELMCLLAAEHELISLPDAERRITPHLGIETLLGRADMSRDIDDPDCLYFKFVGSFKPWHHWVLDPYKAVYLRRRAALEAVFPLDAYPLIQRKRRECRHDAWRDGFARAYETHLQHRPPHA